ncbi:hypothetical protein [Gelidibacter sp.]|uniref:hypothetical protein n=1 Tax=Gelidibacter sp. TaxID=2018083 RepID=UPI002C17143A|nr:hypothetical protein [Gelidibacter sp.]HUH29366.1 hypothetical protein [Gelidibacter sp.]
MNAKILILVGLLIIVFSCKNDDDSFQSEIDGEYIGIFERNENTSKVELHFNNGSFNGQSDIEKFPAICKGAYSISENTISFVNECPWTAEFDWSLILNDKWTFRISKNSLIMTNPNGDKYTLAKQ